MVKKTGLCAIFLSLLTQGVLSSWAAWGPSASVSVNSSATYADFGRSLAIDSSGNIYVIGSIVETAGGDNIWLGKYNSAMVLLASVTINGSGNATDEGLAVALDSNGNVFATGYLNETSGGANIWVGKLNSSLVLQASATLNGPAGGIDKGYGIALDAGGNAYVTGAVWGTYPGERNIWLAKYSPSLALLGSTTVNGSGNLTDIGYAVALDTASNIYVTGQINETSGGYNIWVAKFNPSLALQANVSVNGSGNSSDQGNGIALDPGGNVYVTGFVTESSGGANIWLAKFNSSLTLQATTTINGSNNSGDAGTGIAISSTGIVFATGYVNETPGGNNIWFAKFSPLLIFQASATVNGNGSASSSDIGAGIALGLNGDIYETGYIAESIGGTNIWLGRFSPIDSGSPNIATALNPQFITGSSTTLAASWSNAGSSWIAVLTQSGFTMPLSSGTVISNATSYANLIPGTGYNFKVKIATEPDTSFTSNLISTMTLQTP
ncbi:MAG: SBBP repeat-containing protein, partial [Elusimicrobia bacterium]|nr:SBBP repeat-containing protein [Elusimicrobiota bacterium]